MEDGFCPSLDLQSALRASSETLETVCLCPPTGQLISFDKKAVRLWSQKKQIKAIHWLEGTRRFVGSKWLGNLGAIAVVFQYITSDEAPPQTILQLWNTKLILAQEVEIKCAKPVIFAVSPDQTEILLIEENMVAIVLKLTVDPNGDKIGAHSNIPMFPRERDVKKGPGKWKLPQSAATRPSSAPPPETYDLIPYVIVTETQRFDCPIDIKDCQYKTNDELVMLSCNVLYKLTRVSVPLDVPDSNPAENVQPTSKLAISPQKVSVQAANIIKSPRRRQVDDSSTGTANTTKLSVTVRTDDDVVKRSTPLPHSDPSGSAQHGKTLEPERQRETSRSPVKDNDSDHRRDSTSSAVSNHSNSSSGSGKKSSSISGQAPDANESDRKGLQKHPEMVLMFRLSGTIFLSDPEAPRFTALRMPQSLHLLDSDLLVITWTDGSFELCSTDIGSRMHDEHNPATKINPERLKKLALQSLQRDEDEDEDQKAILSNAVRLLIRVDAHISVPRQPRVTIPRPVDAPPLVPELGPGGISSFQSLNWSTVLSGGGYLYEFISAGVDRRICHWGIRRTLNPSAIGATRSTSIIAGGSQLNAVAIGYPSTHLDKSQASGGFDMRSILLESLSSKAVTWEADLLGAYDVPKDPQSHYSLSSGATVGPSNFIAFEMSFRGAVGDISSEADGEWEIVERKGINSISHKSCLKRLLCSVGGQLLSFRMLQSRRTIAEYPTSIVRSAVGPQQSTIEQQESVHMMDQKTILILRDNVIDAVSTTDGNIIARYQATQILDLTAREVPFASTAPGHGTKVVSTVTQALRQKEGTAVIEGNCTTMHYCNLTKQLLIGFSSGGVGILAVCGPRLNLLESRAGFSVAKAVDASARGNSVAQVGSTSLLMANLTAKNEYPYIRTTDVHSARVTRLVTYRTHGPNPIVVLAVGDAMGVLSTWSLHGPEASLFRKSTSLQNGFSSISTSSNLPLNKLLWKEGAHKGSIIFMEVLHHAGDAKILPVKILVTGCTMGAIKVWDHRSDGTMRLASNFQLSTGLSALSVVPIVVEIEPEPEPPAKPHISRELDTVIAGSIWHHEDDATLTSSATSVYYEPTLGLHDPRFKPIPTSVVTLEILCLCGLQSGQIETWKVSTEKSRVSKSVIQSERFNPTRISCIHNVLANNNRIDESIAFSKYDLDRASFPIICAHQDGTLLQLNILPDGSIKKESYFTHYAPVRNILNCSSYSDMTFSQDCVSRIPVLEVQLVTDKDLSEVLVTATDVPPKWRSIQSKFTHPAQLVKQSRRDSTLSTFSADDHPAATESGQSPGSPIIRIESPKAMFDGADEGLNSTRIGDSKVVIDPQTAKLVEGYLENTGARQSSADDFITFGSHGSFMAEVPLRSMERTINAILHAAKKDPLLLSKFRYALVPPTATTLPVDVAVDVIFEWIGLINDNSVKPKIWELVRLLGIEVTAQLSFEKIAKLASVSLAAFRNHPDYRPALLHLQQNRIVEQHSQAELSFVKSTAPMMHTRSLSSSQSKKPNTASTLDVGVVSGVSGKEYEDLRTDSVAVSYNSMGERVLVPRKLPQGNAKGCRNKLRSVWNKQPCRIVAQEECIPPPAPVAILQQIPSKLQLLLVKDAKLPTKWSPLSENWLDTRKAVKYARSILDFRAQKQRQVYLANSSNSPKVEIEDMTHTVVQFFERKYGTANMGMKISHQRLLNFVEACNQYMQTPVLNFMRRLISPELAAEEVDDTSVWLYVEARNLLESWSSITQGDVVPTAGTQGFYPFLSSEYISTSGSTANKPVHGITAGLDVRWLQITRGDALKCIDVMFRVRGKFGPLAIQRVLTIVSNIPSAVPATDAEMAAEAAAADSASILPVTVPILNSQKPGVEMNVNEYIDLELFLEVLVVEFIKLREYIATVDDTVFGDEFFMRYFPNSASTSQDDVQAFFKLVEYVRSFVLSLVAHDTKRTGIVNEQAFRIALLRFLPSDCNVVHGKYVNSLIDKCVSDYKTRENEDEEASFMMSNVSYCDYWAVLLSWLTLNKVHTETTVGDLFFGSLYGATLVEDQHAVSIISLVGLIQAPIRIDALWTCSEALRAKIFKDNDALLHAANVTSNLLPARSILYGISKDGNWNPHVLPASDAPGLLSVSRAVVSVAKKEQIGTYPEQQATIIDKQTKKFAEMHGLDVEAYPLVPYRTQTNSILDSGREKVPVEKYSVPIIGNDLPELVKPKASYSRSIEVLEPLFEPKVLSRQTDIWQPNEPTQSVGDGSQLPFQLNSTSTSVQSQYLVTDHMHLSAQEYFGVNGSHSPIGNRSPIGNSSPIGPIGNRSPLGLQSSSFDPEKVYKSRSPSPTANNNSQDHNVLSYSSKYTAFPHRTLSPGPVAANINIKFEDPIMSPSSSRPPSRMPSRQISDRMDSRLESRIDNLPNGASRQPSRLASRAASSFDNQRPLLGGGSVWDHSSIILEQESAADTEVERLNSLAEEQNSKFLEKYKAEMLLMDNRMQDRKREEALRLRALREKELAAQIFADQVEKDRLRKLMNTRELMEKRRLEEEEQKRAEEDELKAKIDAQKAKSAKLAMEKQEREDAMKERVREMNENLAMKTEDAASRKREDHDAEQLRIKLYKEQQAAVEAAKKAMAAAAAAREKAEKEEKARREKLQAEERARELAERKLMKAADINVHKIFAAIAKSATPVAVEVQVEERFGESPTEFEDSTYSEEVIPTRKMTWAERRIAMFLDRLQNAEDLNSRHPRRGDDTTSFFMPLTFGDDIRFNPFDSQMEPQATKVMKYEAEEEDVLTSNFSDIVRKVKHHKIMLERERLHLYDTSESQVSPRSGTTIMKTVSVDWEAFLSEEQRNLLKKPEPEPEPIDTEALFLEEMRKAQMKQRALKYGSAKSLSPGTPTSSVAQQSSFSDLPSGLLSEDFGTVTVFPLPAGKVARDTVFPTQSKYYQVAIVDPYCILTVELTGVHGVAELYAAHGYLPTTSKHMMKETNMSKSPEKISRLVLEADGFTGYIFLSVHSPVTGCRFQIWAACSGPAVSDSSSMAEVGKTIRGLSVLANHPNDVLHVQFPVLYKVAHDIAESEANVKHASILAEMNDARKKEEDVASNPTVARVSFTDTLPDSIKSKSSKEIDEDEYNALDRYVQKIGRKAMRKELDKMHSFPSSLQGETPFLHPEMFAKSGLETQDQFASYAVHPVTPPPQDSILPESQSLYASEPILHRVPLSFNSDDMDNETGLGSRSSSFGQISPDRLSSPKGQPNLPKSHSSPSIHFSGSIVSPSLHTMDTSSSAVISAAGSNINDAFVGLFLSRSSTLPKLHGGSSAGDNLHGSTSRNSKTLAANNKSKSMTKDTRLPSGPYLPMLVPPSGQGQVSITGSSSNSNPDKPRKYTDGLLKQARNPTVVTYTLRKI